MSPPSTPPVTPTPPAIALLSLVLDRSTWAFSLSVSIWLAVGAVLVTAALVLLWRWQSWGWALKAFEIDQAELGVGPSKVRLRPNLMDRQVAYAIWVELSTRKIGLPIDFDHDVIAEIYDSWYAYFSVTRELIKNVPVSQFRRDSTQQIVKLSIQVLNEGLRPHLTRWQARFRSWYERELRRFNDAGGENNLDPQQLQARFPQFEKLKEDMERVNKGLINYREKMRELVLKS